MKVSDLIKTLESLNDELKEKDIKIMCPNGIVVSPEIKMVLNKEYDFNSGVKYMMITY